MSHSVTYRSNLSSRRAGSARAKMVVGLCPVGPAALLVALYLWSRVTADPPEPVYVQIPPFELPQTRSNLAATASIPTASITQLLDGVIPKKYQFDTGGDPRLRVARAWAHLRIDGRRGTAGRSVDTGLRPGPSREETPLGEVVRGD